MNQEMEKDRVKVIPVLAGPCDMPGFLKGKYYADMMTPTARSRSLPQLLEQMGGAKERIEEILDGSGRTVSVDDDSWIDQLRQAFSSEDHSARYSGLSMAASGWRREGALLKHLDVLDKVCSVLDEVVGCVWTV